jgi:hypothetical protein
LCHRILGITGNGDGMFAKPHITMAPAWFW